jgi:hypothetical protein
MPTYRITDHISGVVLSSAIQSDSDLSALSSFPEGSIAEQISPNPPAMVYTIAWPLGSGDKLIEVLTTGSRTTALAEMQKQPSGRILIEETPSANRHAAKGRQS